MYTSLFKRLVPVFLSCAIFMTQLPTDATAQWHDKSDELPGTVSTTSIILVGVGSAAAIFLLVKLSKSGNASKAKTAVRDSVKSAASNLSGSNLYTQSNTQRSVPEPRVALFVNANDYGSKSIDSFQRNMNFKNKTLSVGLSLGL